jgi:hypothetical protein
MNATDKPVVVVLVNGGLASIDSLANSTQRLAIVEAMLPGNTGATAVAQALYGANTWGKVRAKSASRSMAGVVCECMPP